MKEFEIPPFYVGQEVVAIKNHSGGKYKKGDEFVVRSIQKSCCGWVMDIGIVGYTGTDCARCGKTIDEVDWLFNSRGFSPKIELSDFVSMKQLAETQLEIIGAN